jgi:Glycine rich protein
MKVPRLFYYAALAGLAAPAMRADTFAYTGTYVSWIVPTTGTYVITAIGAQGGAGESSYVGGLGAEIEGTFSLTAGSVLWIAVGGQGLSSRRNGGGGGGSFVVDSSDNP